MEDTKTNELNMYEMPYAESQPIETEAGFYEKQNNVKVTENVKKDLALNQAALSFSDGGDPTQSFSGVLAAAPEDVKQSNIQSFVEKEGSRVTQTLKASLELEPEQMELVVKDQQNRMLTVEKELEVNTKLAPYLSYVEQVEGSHTLTHEAKKAIAADLLVGNTISEIWDGLSKWGVVKNFAGMVVVPDDNWNTMQFAKGLPDKKETEKGFEDIRFWEQYSAKRDQLSPEERVLFDERTLELLEGVDDNKVEYIMNLSRSIGHDVESANDLGMERLELATSLAGVGPFILRNLSKVSKLVTAAKTGNVRLTEFFAKMSLKSENAGAEVGVHPIDAAASGSGITGEAIKPVIKGVVPEEMAPVMRNMMDNLDKNLEDATNILDLEQHILAPADLAVIGEQVGKRFSKEGNITNISAVNNKGAVEVSFDIISDEGVKTTKEVSFTYTKDDIGVGLFESSNSVWGAVNKPVASPMAVMGKDTRDFVELVEVTMHQQAKVNNALIRGLNSALAPIKNNQKSLKSLDTVLHKLNGKEVELGYNELVVQGYGGQRLTPKEFVAWKGVRHLMDNVHAMNNKTLREEMSLRGVKAVELGDNKSAYVRVYNTPNDAMRGWNADNHSNVLVVGERVDNTPADFSKISIEDVKEMEAKGYQLVKTDSADIDDTFAFGKSRYRFAFVKKSEVKPLDDQVLNYVPNYMPVTRKDANYFIRVQEEVLVDGKLAVIPRTKAFATTKAQAEKWMDKFNTSRLESGLEEVVFEPLKFEGEKVVGGSDDVVRINGGLVRGSRSKSKLEYAGDIDSDDMINDPLNSVQDALNFTAKRMPMSRFRIGLQERLYNELDNNNIDARSAGWGSVRDLIKGSNLDTQPKSRLLTAYDQVDALVGIPTKAEQGLQAMIRSVAKSFDKNSPKTATWLYRNSHRNPVQAIKNGSFNLTLGSLSVVQLPIQMMSAANAFAVAPAKFALALPKAIYSATFDNTSGKFLAKSFADKKSYPEGFDKDYLMWEKSGFRESVIQAGGDFGSIARGQPFDAGALRRGFDSTVSTGQIFFSSGELWNRRFSFFTALEEIKSSKGSKFSYSDDDLVEVMARAERMMLGMGSGNKAPFQKGFWGLPLQFKQIYTKSIEAYTGDWFTPAEKARIGLVQVGLFGSAGIPFVSSMADYLIGTIPNVEDLSEEDMALIRRGIGGWLVNDYLDIDALFSGRMTSSVDLWGEIQKTFLEDVSFFDTAFGASLGPINNSWKAIKAAKHEAGAMLSADDLGTDQILASASIVGQSLLDIPSGSRNLVAAYDLYNNRVFRNSKGQPIAATDPSLRDALARAVGYQSQEKNDLYELAMSDRALKESRKARADMFIYTLHKLAISREDDDLREAYKYQLEYLKNDIKSYEDGSAILKDIGNRLKDATGKKEKAIEQAFKNRNSDMVDAMNKVSLLLREE